MSLTAVRNEKCKLPLSDRCVCFCIGRKQGLPFSNFPTSYKPKHIHTHTYTHTHTHTHTQLVDSFLDRQYEVIVLGDFNDYDGEILDINNNIPKSHVLEILKKGTSTHTHTHTHPHTHTRGGMHVHGGGWALEDGETDRQTDRHTQSNNRELVSAGIFAQKEDLYTDWWDKNGDCVATDDEWDAIDHVRNAHI